MRLRSDFPPTYTPNHRGQVRTDAQSYGLESRYCRCRMVDTFRSTLVLPTTATPQRHCCTPQRAPCRHVRAHPSPSREVRAARDMRLEAAADTLRSLRGVTSTLSRAPELSLSECEMGLVGAERDPHQADSNNAEEPPPPPVKRASKASSPAINEIIAIQNLSEKKQMNKKASPSFKSGTTCNT